MRFEKGDLEQTHRLENIRRSVAMLPPGAPALNREEAVDLLEALVRALLEARRRETPHEPKDTSKEGQP